MQDTICAISTALGVGAISIIRVSGTKAIEVVNSIFETKNLEKVKSHTIHHGFIMSKKKKVDEVLVSIMKKPKTFTKEDVIEINCHGGIATTNKVLELLLESGCRLAEPGEFTKRAFLNGRIDLAQAEAIGDIIQSKTNTARKLAMAQIEGKLSKMIKDIRQDLLEILANIEVNIDYPEYEDAPFITMEIIREKLKTTKVDLTKLLNESENGRLIKEGIKVALAGKPNVGKSSILNFLLDEEKAIVTDIAGTTRDAIEGQISLDGIALNIIDTAGIRETADYVEQLGVKKSEEIIVDADLVIYILSADEKVNEQDFESLEKIAKEKLVVFINKTDLETNTDFKEIEKYSLVYGNTVRENGLDNLKQKIRQKFNLEEIASQDFTYVSNVRQISLIKKAILQISEVLDQKDNEIPIDIISIDIKSCWETLGEIIGETYKEELLDELFSKFCLGK